MAFPLRFLLPMCCLYPLAAAELVLRDLHVGLTVLPTDFDYDLSGSTPASGSDGFSSGIGFTIGGSYSLAAAGSRHGLVLGLEGDLELYGLETGGGEMTTMAARLFTGYGVAINDRIQVTFLPYAGYGLSDLEIPDNDNFSGVSGTGSTLIYGARLGVQVPVSRRLALGLEVGWRTSSTTLSADDIDLDLDQNGLSFGLTMAWRWDDIPTLLDQ